LLLSSVGYIREDEDPDDRRRKKIYLQISKDQGLPPSRVFNSSAKSQQLPETNQTFMDIPAIINQFEKLLPERFIENDFVQHVVTLGYSEKESNELFRKLIDGGSILRDPDGFWQWVW
jgi:hypothetical protein